MSTAKDARKYILGIFHPTFSLLQVTKDFLLENLSDDAHVRASGKLCVSLTRASDGENVLVSEFESREELIQHYIDGALSNNMPLFDLGNTITMSPFSGESDICPREGTFNFLEVHYGNVSIQVNTSNVHRIYTSFFPPEPEMLAEVCHNGYMDALRFLSKNNLLRREYVSPSMVAGEKAPRLGCCEPVNEAEEMDSTEKLLHRRLKLPQQQHLRLDQQDIVNLPADIKKILCEACKEKHTGGSLLSWMAEFLPVKSVSCLLVPCTRSVELTLSLARRCDSGGGYSALSSGLKPRNQGGKGKTMLNH